MLSSRLSKRRAQLARIVGGAEELLIEVPSYFSAQRLFARAAALGVEWE